MWDGWNPGDGTGLLDELLDGVLDVFVNLFDNLSELFHWLGSNGGGMPGL